MKSEKDIVRDILRAHGHWDEEPTPKAVKVVQEYGYELLKSETGREAAMHVLSFYGYGGYEPGGFTTNLLKAFSTADSGNFAKLSMAFPEYGAAMQLGKNTAGGIERLQELTR